MRNFLIWTINIYQKIPFKSHSSCVFIPTCSEYTKESIIKHGSLKGIFYGFLRICRCHPWQKNHYDSIK